MRLLIRHVVLLCLVWAPPGEAATFMGRRMQHLWCQNSCLAPSTHQTTTTSNIGSTTTLSVPPDENDNEDGPSNKDLLLDAPSHYRTHIVDKAKEETTIDSVWDVIRAFRQRSFVVVPLPRIKQENGSPRSSRHQKRSAQSSQPKVKQPSGTRFDLRPPSAERIARWFAPANEKAAGLWGNRQKQKKKKSTGVFNHDSVGMTNPVLHVTRDRHINSNGGYDVSTSTGTGTPMLELEDSWIPASSVSTTTTTTSTRQQQQASPSVVSSDSEEDKEANHWARVLQYKLQTPPQDPTREAAERAWFPAISSNSNTNSNKWRQCRYRRRVGRGQDCYERVREAALGWQFNHTQGHQPTKGILAVHSNSKQPQSQSSCFSLDDHASQQVQPLWSGPHTGGSRRLVTYTTTGFKTRWLPKLYTMNPVMVVYDLMDQRGPGTTYTSTAYATLRGHLLRGEERVTVAFRDDTGFVDVEILSYSKSAESVRAKCVWPLIGNMQQKFFQHQMDFLEGVALPPKPLPTPPAGSTTTTLP